MDAREGIIRAVITALNGRAPDEIINMVQDVLVLELNNYEIQERCTDVAVRDNSAEGLLRRFIATKRVEGIAESTLRRYADQNLKLIRFLGKQLNKVTTYDLRFYLSSKRQQGRLNNRSLDGMRRCFSSFFSWLSAEGLIDRNPCSSLARIKYRKDVLKPYTATEMDDIRMSCKNIRDLAIVDMMYATGCRISELVDLDICDIDFEKRQCVVLGKGNKERIVYISEVAAANLKRYLINRTDTSDALFAGRGTERLTKAGMRAAVKRVGQRAGVQEVYPHKYRRTLATNMLSRGAAIQDVATILGHADYKTTQIYCTIVQANVQAAYRKYAA